MLRALAVAVAAVLAALVLTVGLVAPRHAASSGSPRPAGLAAAAASPIPTDGRPIPRLPEVAHVEDPWPEDDPDAHAEGPWPGDDPYALEPDEDEGWEPDSPAADSPAVASDGYQPSEADRAFLERGLRFVEELVAAIEDNAGSCDRMADSLERLFLANAELLAEARRLDSESPERAGWFARQAESRLTATAERLVEPLQGCMHSERLMAVLTNLAA